MGRLTTHVLDTAHGRPAAGLVIELWRENDPLECLGRYTTNDDGRLDAPLLADDAFEPGHYEIRFFAGAYFRLQGVDTEEPSFLDIVPVRFGIANADEHYHVPLLIAPYGYSTYRGS
ncbi:MAG: hydroxyisourate hydrolase [Pseudomonadota bacterium]